MKGILAMTAAAALVLVQIGVVAAWTAEPPLDFSPESHPALVAGQRA